MVEGNEDRKADHVEDEDYGEEAAVDVDESMAGMAEDFGLAFWWEESGLVESVEG